MSMYQDRMPTENHCTSDNIYYIYKICHTHLSIQSHVFEVIKASMKSTTFMGKSCSYRVSQVQCTSDACATEFGQRGNQTFL